MTGMSPGPTSIASNRCGVYRSPAAMDALRKAAVSAGLVWLDMPLAAVNDKAQFLALAKRQMKLPDHFGDNWDALADCLRDFDWLKSKGYVLHLRDGQQFAAAAPQDYQTALDVLAEAAEYWKGRNTPFVVFIDGATQLPSY